MGRGISSGAVWPGSRLPQGLPQTAACVMLSTPFLLTHLAQQKGGAGRALQRILPTPRAAPTKGHATHSAVLRCEFVRTAFSLPVGRTIGRTFQRHRWSPLRMLAPSVVPSAARNLRCGAHCRSQLRSRLWLHRQPRRRSSWTLRSLCPDLVPDRFFFLGGGKVIGVYCMSLFAVCLPSPSQADRARGLKCG